MFGLVVGLCFLICAQDWLIFFFISAQVDLCFGLVPRVLVYILPFYFEDLCFLLISAQVSFCTAPNFGYFVTILFSGSFVMKLENDLRNVLPFCFGYFVMKMTLCNKWSIIWTFRSVVNLDLIPIINITYTTNTIFIPDKD